MGKINIKYDATSKIELPENLDVLVYVHLSKEKEGYVGFFVAHAMQYNVSTDASSPEEAVDKLVHLVAKHCQDALARGSCPVSFAEGYYFKAFSLGEDILDNFYHRVRARIYPPSLKKLGDWADTFAYALRFMHVRSICSEQERSGEFDLRVLVEGRG